MMVDEINIKLLILGLGGVGKTSLVNACLGKTAPDRYIPTIGSNISRKEYQIEKRKNLIRISIWDVGGQRSFNPLNPTVFNNVDAVFLVFDLTKPKETIKEIKEFYLKKLYKSSEDSLIFIVGNKLDLIKNRDDLKSIVDEFSTDEVVPLVFLSAKSDENVPETFDLLTWSYLSILEKRFSKDEKLRNIAQNFLTARGYEENDLKSLFVNAENIESLTTRKKGIAPITRRRVSESESEEGSGLKEYLLLKQKIKEMDNIKLEIIEEFNQKLGVVEDLINSLKTTPIDQLIQTIENIKNQLDTIKDDFELSLDSFLNIEKGEKQQEEMPKKTEQEEDDIKIIDEVIKID